MSEQVFFATIFAWFIAQTLKVLFLSFANQKFSFDYYFATGGIPSVHTAIVTALATSIYMVEGFSILFVVAFVFAAVTIRDATGVRLQSTKQAILINKLLRKEHINGSVNEMVGHTAIQAFYGAVLGFCVAYTWFFVFVG